MQKDHSNKNKKMKEKDNMRRETATKTKFQASKPKAMLECKVGQEDPKD